DGAYQVGFRAHQLEVAAPCNGRHAFVTTVSVTEITGSESFVHLKREGYNWVAVLSGIHEFLPGQELEAVLDPNDLFIFDQSGRLVAAPAAR
ncbi:ABC transporter ATP-binding protein, partial [Maribellus luteus]